MAGLERGARVRIKPNCPDPSRRGKVGTIEGVRATDHVTAVRVRLDGESSIEGFHPDTLELIAN